MFAVSRGLMADIENSLNYFVIIVSSVEYVVLGRIQNDTLNLMLPDNLKKTHLAFVRFLLDKIAIESSNFSTI